MKKSLLFLSSVVAATIAAPLAAVVACGDESSTSYGGRYNLENDGNVSIMNVFAKAGVQHQALEDVVNAWNGANTTKKINIVDVNGGYKAIAPQLSQSFEAADKVKVPNMVIDYPDTIGTLAKYDMTLNLDDDQNSLASLFDAAFTDINNQIGGVPNGGLYALPIAKSIDMATFNGPVWSRIVSVARTNNLFAAPGPSTAEIDAIIAKGKDDVSALWKTKAGYAYSGAKFDDAILSDASKMLDFVTEAIKMFEPNKENFILGIDSIVNFIYQNVFSAVDAKYDDFLFSKDSKSGYINYNWDDKNSAAFKAFSSVYNKLRLAVDSGAVFINDGQFSSSKETVHKIGVAYGSTAGYTYNYLPGTAIAKVTINGVLTTLQYTDKATVDTNAGDTKLLTFGTGKSITVFTDKETAATGDDIVLKDGTVTQKVAALIADNTADKLFVSSADGLDKLPATQAVKLETANPKYQDHPKYLVVAEAVQQPDTTLQEDELTIRETATKFGTNGATASLLQGPSLIGVHNNDTEDAIVKEFTKWLMTGSGSFDLTNDGVANPETMTPIVAFAKKANYIVPTKSILSGTFKGNAAVQLTFNALKDISANHNHHGFDNPVDDTTGNFRAVLDTILSAQYTQYMNGNKAVSAESIYESVQKSFK